MWHGNYFRYSWTKNGKPYEWQVYDDRISQQPGRGTLVITSPRDEDIGILHTTNIPLSLIKPNYSFLISISSNQVWSLT